MLTYCKDCGKEILEKSTYCQKCYLYNHNPMGNFNKKHRLFWGDNIPKCTDCNTKY